MQAPKPTFSQRDSTKEDTKEPPIVRHPTLYVEDVGDSYKIIRVEQTLFRVHFATLIGFSALFVPPSNLGAEGTTDDNPIVVVGDTARHWEGLLEWRKFDRIVLSDVDWVGILVLSKKYVSEPGVRHATHHLAQPNSIPATYRLRLALKFHLPELVRVGIEALLKPPFAALNAQDLRDLEPDMTAIINEYRQKITARRMTLVCHLAAFIHDFRCYDTEVCESNWSTAYRSCTRLLANPTSAASGREVLAKFELEKIPSMDIGCFTYTIDSIKANQSFWKEERFVNEAVVAAERLVADENRLTTFSLRVYNPVTLPAI